MTKVSSTKLPFDEQINFFLKKLNLPTDSYLDLQGKEHDYAFVVAGQIVMTLSPTFAKRWIRRLTMAQP